MDYSDQEAIQHISALFEQCRLIHQKSYPTTSIDFDRMNLTGRLEHGRWAHANGHFSDVYKGETDEGIVVAVKTLRLPGYSPSNDKIYRRTVLRFFREFNNWSQLDHVNVVFMYGYSLSGGNLSLVSPWHTNGSLVEYIYANSDASKDDLALDVAEGIDYLHTRESPLVHGDLKGANILVNENGIACIADFGLSKQIDDLNRQTGFSTSSNATGTLPFTAPELSDGAQIGLPCDVYSCAGVFIQIYCPGKVPYHYIKSSYQIFQAKGGGEIPERAYYPEMGDQDVVWALMTKCWECDPERRPTIGAVVLALKKQFQMGARRSQSNPLRPRLQTHLPQSTPALGSVSQNNHQLNSSSVAYIPQAESGTRVPESQYAAESCCPQDPRSQLIGVGPDSELGASGSRRLDIQQTRREEHQGGLDILGVTRQVGFAGRGNRGLNPEEYSDMSSHIRVSHEVLGMQAAGGSDGSSPEGQQSATESLTSSPRQVFMLRGRLQDKGRSNHAVVTCPQSLPHQEMAQDPSIVRKKRAGSALDSQRELLLFPHDSLPPGPKRARRNSQVGSGLAPEVIPGYGTGALANTVTSQQGQQPPRSQETATSHTIRTTSSDAMQSNADGPGNQAQQVKQSQNGDEHQARHPGPLGMTVVMAVDG